MPMKAINYNRYFVKNVVYFEGNIIGTADNPLINQTSTVTMKKTLTMYGVRHNITLNMYVG